MATLVLTVIGDDRAGLVGALSDVVAANGGNWTTSQMSELAGKFAGIVTVEVPDEGVDALTAALRTLAGLLDVTVHPGRASEPTGQGVDLELVGNDRPGIVQEITHLLADERVSLDSFSSSVEDAPMSGGQLFRAKARLRLPEGTDTAPLSSRLEQLADELMVELKLSAGEA